MKTAVVLVLAIAAQAAGNVFLAIGMRAAGAHADWLTGAAMASHDPNIWIGSALLLAFFILCSAALSWADLSFVLPATAAGYVLNVAAARYVLHEEVSTARWIGSILIVIGVYFVSRSSPSTAGAA